MNTEDVLIPSGRVMLEGKLVTPDSAKGLVIFAHGSGSSRHSPRNRYVAQTLEESHLATLLMDLLTASEERIDRQTAELRFNIGLLAERLTSAVDWCVEHPSTATLPLGLFGASTGAAAALITAAERPVPVRAVVSRGGRPDLAESALGQVQAPTLLIVGGNDDQVISLNESALQSLAAEKQLEIVPGASHLFEEAGALDQVAALAACWFTSRLSNAASRSEAPPR